jgi:hypothetical protein
METCDLYSDGTQIVTRTERCIRNLERNDWRRPAVAQPKNGDWLQPSSGRKGGLVAAGFAAIALTGGAVVWSHDPAPNAPALRIALAPPQDAGRGSPQNHPPARAVHDKTAGFPPPPTLTALVAPAAAELATASATTQSTATDANDDVAASVQAALVKGFATGEPQSWRTEMQNGIVVVGPAQATDGVVCRDVAIFTRDEGESGQTLNSQRCLSHGKFVIRG